MTFRVMTYFVQEFRGLKQGLSDVQTITTHMDPSENEPQSSTLKRRFELFLGIWPRAFRNLGKTKTKIFWFSDPFENKSLNLLRNYTTVSYQKSKARPILG